MGIVKTNASGGGRILELEAIASKPKIMLGEVNIQHTKYNNAGWPYSIHSICQFATRTSGSSSALMKYDPHNLCSASEIVHTETVGGIATGYFLFPYSGYLSCDIELNGFYASYSAAKLQVIAKIGGTKFYDKTIKGTDTEVSERILCNSLYVSANSKLEILTSTNDTQVSGSHSINAYGTGLIKFIKKT